MGTMFDYIKNSKCFKDKNLYDQNGDPLPDAEIQKAIKLCFKYTQDRVREQYHDYLVNEKKKKIVREKLNARMKEKEERERHQQL
jgi:hypothetical protein